MVKHISRYKLIVDLKAAPLGCKSFLKKLNASQ